MLAESDGRLPDHDDIEHVVVLGMGGSGVAGDVAIAVAGPFMAVPVVVHKGYGLPNFVDRHTLVVAVSFSGETEETLESAALAADAGASLVAVTRGGSLGELARRRGAPVIGVAERHPRAPGRAGGGGRAPAGGVRAPRPVPRGLGVDRRGRRASCAAGATSSACPTTRPSAWPATSGARSRSCTAAGAVGTVAARRWKTQFNENAKMPAFSNELPELCHNEVSGWGQHGDVTRQVFRIVDLRHEFEHPQIARRFALVDDLLGEVVAGIDEVVAEGEGTLAQLFDLVLFGDFVSLYRATQEGIDPGPVPAIDDLKANLAP